MHELAKATRIEVIDHTPNGEGRVFVKYFNNMAIDTSFQDNERTLKIFIRDTKAPVPINRSLTRQLYAYNLLKEAAKETASPNLDKAISYLKLSIENEAGSIGKYSNEVIL